MGRSRFEERNARIVEAWRGGRTFRSIAADEGVTHQRIIQIIQSEAPGEYRDWQKARKDRTARKRACPVCGGPKSWHAVKCSSCHDYREALRDRTIWSRESIIACIRKWNEVYGRPPTAAEWNPAMSRNIGRTDWTERFYADGCWPHYTTVQTRFGRWNLAIEAAGFTPRRVGGREFGSGHLAPVAVNMMNGTPRGSIHDQGDDDDV